MNYKILTELLNKTWPLDCLDGMRYLPNETIDFVLTDPPYNIGLKYKNYKDDKKEYWTWIEQVYREFYRVLKPQTHLVFTCAQLHIWLYRPLLENMGFKFRHLGIWHNPKRKAGSWPGMWPYSWEAVMDFTKGKYRKLNNSNGVGFMDVWIEQEPPGIKHPAKRPVGMWRELVRLCSRPDEIILDAFMGSGTTAAVVKAEDRQFIGFEIDPYYVEMAEARHV